ncbi:hypothetical protein GIB67_039725 [Kingdonia uniflora]|uniref:Uncharacterized protein n=1 Tax=Kingdonia uniflora TaxID=39325 RepID=A0A7J7MQ50_9MAGN|nr:hypothetical protein GIB67_039725 [Kingdonia uniflora]
MENNIPIRLGGSEIHGFHTSEGDEASGELIGALSSDGFTSELVGADSDSAEIELNGVGLAGLALSTGK